MATPVSQGGIDYQDGGFGTGTDIYPMTLDVGELAARLGSPCRFDRRGNVIFVDSFESGLEGKWRKNFDHTGTPITSAAAARTGAYSAKLATLEVSSSSCGMIHYRPLPRQQSLGVEMSFSLNSYTSGILLQVELYDGSNYSRWAVKYLLDDDKWQYYDSNGNWQDAITGTKITALAEAFYTVKLVFDYETDEYVRLLVNDQSFDMADIACYTAADTTTPVMRVYITVTNDDSTEAVVYVDDVIITQNEP